MDLKSVMEPAIEIAENGYDVSKLLNSMMEKYSQKLSKFPAAARIYLKERSVLPQILMNMIDHKITIQEAINAPRFHCMADREIFVEPRIPQEIRDVLTRKGYDVVVKESFDLYFGGAQGVMNDPETRGLRGGADPRREGSVMSY